MNNGIDKMIANRLISIVNCPWETDIDDVKNRRMVKKMESNFSELYSIYYLIFDYDVKKNEFGMMKAYSKIEVGVNVSSRSSVVLGRIKSASIVNGHLEITICDSNDDETILKIKVKGV